VKILIVNHTGAVSGAERSMLDLISGLRDQDHVRVACPRSGPLAAAARALGVGVDIIPGTDGSLKLHPRETPRALGRLAAAAALTARHARSMDADIIHANSIRSGLLTVPAARATTIPAVVHVRDRLPRSAVADGSLRLIASGARTVIANSRYTADGVREVTARGRMTIVYNPVDRTRFDRSAVDRAAARRRIGVKPGVFVLAVVGQITPWKGQLDALELVAQLRREGRDVELLLVGEPKFVSAATRYDNRAYDAELTRFIAAHDLADAVHLLGEREDMPAIMSAIDALLVPSWAEPFGRVVVEAMALGRPVVATSVGGPAEIIRDGVDGILLAPRSPRRWAQAVGALIDSAELRAGLGRAASARAEDFSLPAHVSAMRAVYAQAAGR
jgi:glycosyltransferase involved in cell wall biosynthesis